MPWDQGPGLRSPGDLVPGFSSKSMSTSSRTNLLIRKKVPKEFTEVTENENGSRFVL
jgi:hypothetical protein